MLEIVGENAKKPSVRGAPKKREGSADLLLGAGCMLEAGGGSGTPL